MLGGEVIEVVGLGTSDLSGSVEGDEVSFGNIEVSELESIESESRADESEGEKAREIPSEGWPGESGRHRPRIKKV